MHASGPLRPIARRALAAQSDERLVRLMREGHEPAFEETVRRYRGPLVAFAAAIVSADRAEDVVQSSLMKAHHALRRDDREIVLRPWLFAIVRNGALNEIRGEAPVDELREASTPGAGPSEIAEQREELDRLVVAMCALPAAQRQALVKRELEGVGHGEIAAQLGTTATAVRGLIFRARTGLRDALGALLPLPLVRTLLAEGTAAGIAGGGATAGIVGGTAAKGGAAVTAAVVALGTGIALERGGRDEPKAQRADAAGAQAPEHREARQSVAPQEAPSGATAVPEESDGGASGPSSSSGESSDSGQAGESGGSGESVSPSSSAGSSSDGSGDDGGSSGTSGSGSDDGGGDGGDDSGSSGSGSGDDPASAPPPADDNSGPGSSSSGSSLPPPPEDDSSGSSGSGGNSGPGGGGEIDPPDEEIDDDSSGSGGGGSSGSG